MVERATIVVGADGRHSMVAEAVGAEAYDEKPQLQASYYAYWSGLPMDGRFETYIRHDGAFGAWPTNDERTLVIAGRPFAEFEAYRSDIESTYLAIVDLAPAFAERLRSARGRRGSSGRRSRTIFGGRSVPAGSSSAMPATTSTSSRPSA